MGPGKAKEKKRRAMGKEHRAKGEGGRAQGRGKRFFASDNPDNKQQIKLVDTIRFKLGVISLQYEKAT